MKLTPHIVSVFNGIQTTSGIFFDSIIGGGDTYESTFEFATPLLKYLKTLVEEDYHLDNPLPAWVMRDWFNIVYGIYGSNEKSKQFELAVNLLVKNEYPVVVKIDDEEMLDNGLLRHTQALKM